MLGLGSAFAPVSEPTSGVGGWGVIGVDRVAGAGVRDAGDAEFELRANACVTCDLLAQGLCWRRRLRQQNALQGEHEWGLGRQARRNRRERLKKNSGDRMHAS